MRWALGLAAAFILSMGGPLAAQEPAPPPEEPGPEKRFPLEESFELDARLGFAFFSYRESSAGADSDHDSRGSALDLGARLRLSQRFRLNLAYAAAFIEKDTERWDNIGTVLGLVVDQENDLEVDFHLLDVDLSYSLVKRPGLEWALAAGWHYYREDFTRSNFRFIVANITIPTAIAPVSEDVRGQGVKLGTTIRGQLAPGVRLDGRFSWNILYDVKADNSVLGTVESDGNSLRWGVGLSVQVAERFDVGLSYEGLYIRVEEGRSAIAILPKNETHMNTFFVGLTLRF